MILKLIEKCLSHLYSDSMNPHEGANNNENIIMGNDANYTKEELIAKLKDIANDDAVHEPVMGARCYCPIPRKNARIRWKCPTCGKRHSYKSDNWSRSLKEELDLIERKVNLLKSLKADAKLEVFCYECMTENSISDMVRQTKDYPIFVFGFKAKDQSDWHKSIIHSADDLNILEAFLRNQRMYTVQRDRKFPIREDIAKIEKLTGLKLNND